MFFRKKRIVRFIIFLSIFGLIVSSYYHPDFTSAKEYSDLGEPIPQEEMPEIVVLEVPDEKTALKIMELGIEIDHGIYERDGIWEVEAVVTPSQIRELKEAGITVKDAVMLKQIWQERINERNQVLQQQGKILQEEEHLQILRANHYTNQTASFLYVEAKSNKGVSASTILTAYWEENGVEKSATMARKVDYGEYLYHYLELPIEGIPETVTVVSNQGSTVTSAITEWLGDVREEPNEHYVKEFVDHYMDPGEIYERMEQLAAEFPELAEIIELPYKTNGYRRHAMATLGSYTNTAVVVTSKAWGHEGGNDIEVIFKNPEVENASLEVTVEGTTITVQLATDDEGNLVSTAREVVDALNEKASDLITATTYRGNSGNGLAETVSAKLTDGLQAPNTVSRDPATVIALRIGKSRDGSKTGVLGYAQEHAREWVTPLVVVETAERLLRNYAHDENTRTLVDHLDIFLVPVVNVDGANYSFYDYNMQRKNMVNYCPPDGPSDFAARNSWGVDLNRNHSVGSIFDGYVGASTNCTSGTYAGPFENSEPEAQNLVWLADTFENIKFAMNIHSHGGYFMWSPGAYDANRVTLPRPTAGEEAYYWEASEHILSRIKEHRGTVIKPSRTGPIPDVLYSAAGNSADYLWYEKGIYAWNFEVGAELWDGNRWVSVGFQPPYEEGHEEAMEFANGLIGLFEVAYEYSIDKENPTSRAVPDSGKYPGEIEVSFETSEPATVYYTLDGTKPTFNSPAIQLAGTREGAEKLKIAATTTIKYFAVDASGNVENNYDPTDPNDHNYNSATYTIGGDMNRPPGIDDLEALVYRFLNEGEYYGSVIRQMQLYLEGMKAYENRGEWAKLTETMERFINFLTTSHSRGLMSDLAYNQLIAYINYLLSHWDFSFNAERVMEHIKYLSVDIGPRVAGADGEKRASEYLKKQFEALGYEVELQEFSIPGRMVGELRTEDGNIPMNVASGSSYTDDEGITAKLVDAELGRPEDFPEDVAGNIALIARGEFTFAEKVQNAIHAGAIGVIIYDNVDSISPLNPSLGGNMPIPVVGIRKVDGESLLEKMENGDVTATMIIHYIESPVSYNVIAKKVPEAVQNPDIVYITAHYDSVPNSPGANDNASGTSTMLELARILKDVPTSKEIRFIAFGAEELGLLGSQHYVNELSEEEIERSIASFNLDMVGTAYEPASQLHVSPVDGSPDNLVWKSVKAAADELGFPEELLNLNAFGRSDHVPFHQVGIDSALFIWMVPGTEGLEPWYHTPEDKIEHISPERIQIVGDIIGTAVEDLLTTVEREDRLPVRFQRIAS